MVIYVCNDCEKELSENETTLISNFNVGGDHGGLLPFCKECYKKMKEEK